MKKMSSGIGFLIGVLVTAVIAVAVYFFALQEDTTLVETKYGKVTQEDVYNALKRQYGSEALVNLVHQQVFAEKYTVTDEELNKRLDLIRGEFRTQNNAELDDSVEALGFSSMDEVKKLVKGDLYQEKFQLDGVEVTDQEIQEYYDENYKADMEISHILVADEATANTVKAQLDAGGDFAALAKQYSSDTSKDSGGVAGLLSTSEANWVPEFAAVAKTLKDGEISAPTKSKFGYHIIKATAKPKPALADEKENITLAVKNSKIDQDALHTRLADLLKDADLDIKDAFYKNAFTQQPATQQ